jgi:DNA replication protein DnaC
MADSLLGEYCHVCFRKASFDSLPEEAKKNEYLSVVPERFIMAEIKHLAKNLQVTLMDETDTGIMLWGSPGIGKSYALCAAVKYFISEGYICRRINYELLCLKLRDTFKSSSQQSEWGIIEPLINCDKLIIEDIGTTKSIDSKESDFSLRTLLVLIDLRLEHCRGTYITTNKSLENLTQSFDTRIGDRLRLYEIIKMQGQSKR